MKQTKRILVVSGKQSLTWELYNQLGRNDDLEMMTEEQGHKAYRTIKQLSPDMVIVDFETPGLEQSWLSAHLESEEPFQNLPVVVLTNTLGQDEREIAMDMLGHSFLAKETAMPLLTKQLESRLAH